MILDTNALSGLADGDPQLKVALAKASLLAIPVIVLGEYRYSIGQSREQARYEAWLEQVVADCHVLNIDGVTARLHAVVRGELKRVGRSIPANDVWIAALCRQHALPVLSRDVHFDDVPGIRRISW